MSLAPLPGNAYLFLILGEPRRARRFFLNSLWTILPGSVKPGYTVQGVEPRKTQNATRRRSSRPALASSASTGKSGASGRRRCGHGPAGACCSKDFLRGEGQLRRPGDGGDGVKVALALLWERRYEVAGTVPVLAVHDAIV